MPRDEARYGDPKTGDFDEEAWRRDNRKELKSSQKKDNDTEESRARRGKEQR